MGIYNSESVRREAEKSDTERNLTEEVDVIYGYDDAVGSTAKVTQGLIEGKKLPEIKAEIHGNLATDGKRFGFEGEQDGAEYLIKTKNGELVVVNIESLAQLSEDLRMLPSGYSVRDLMKVVEGKQTNPDIYAKATTLFTPEEKLGIASDAVENILLLNDERVGRAVSTFVSGTNEIFILTAEDYQDYKAHYNPNTPQTDHVYKKGTQVGLRNYRYSRSNGRAFTAEATIAKDDVQVLIVRESNIFDRRKATRLTGRLDLDTERARQTSRLEACRSLTHEFVHSAGIGSHLGPMEEMAVEFYAIRAQTLGEQKRAEKSESLNMGYEAGVSFFAELYNALQERMGMDPTTLDRAFMWGETKEMQQVINTVGELLGKEGGTKLAKWDFKNDAEAYLWLRDKLA